VIQGANKVEGINEFKEIVGIGFIEKQGEHCD